MSTLDPKRMRKLTTLLERAIGVTATLFGGRSRAMLMCRMSTLSAELLGQVESLGEGAVWVAIGMAAAGGATSTGAVRRMTALGAEGTGELGTLLLLERAVGVPVGVAGGFSVAAVGGVTALCSDLFELVFGEIGKVGGVGGSHVAMGWLEGGPPF